MELKINDWVVISGEKQPKQITSLSYGIEGDINAIFCGQSHYPINYVKPWKVKKGELCWFWNLNPDEKFRHPILARFVSSFKTSNNQKRFECDVLILVDTVPSHEIRVTNYFDHCEPFTNEPPTFYAN